MEKELPSGFGQLPKRSAKAMAFEDPVRGNVGRSISQKRQAFRQPIEPKAVDECVACVRSFEKLGQYPISRVFASGTAELAKARVQQLHEAGRIATNSALVQRGFQIAKLIE